MPWNWQLPNWPHFEYDPAALIPLDQQFLLRVGMASGYLKAVDEEGIRSFMVEVLSVEGVQSAKIEGESLDRESLQSSIQRHFGFHSSPSKKVAPKEAGMAELLCDLYDSFDAPLTHEMLWRWHKTLLGGHSNLSEVGMYRTHPDPMQIVSNRYGSTHVFFEAPPSHTVLSQMTQFLQWFNEPSTGSILGKAAIAHVYFESIHPFEDGNGRIGRAIAEKMLSKCVGRPLLVAISKRLERRKKEYYAALEQCNRTLAVQPWVEFFSNVVLEAHAESMELLYFLIEKSKLLQTFRNQINLRQMKALLRMFQEGPSGFQGGLSAEKYISITKASRATATRDLSDLVKKGALIKRGSLRHARYYLPIVATQSQP